MGAYFLKRQNMVVNVHHDAADSEPLQEYGAEAWSMGLYKIVVKGATGPSRRKGDVLEAYTNGNE